MMQLGLFESHKAVNLNYDDKQADEWKATLSVTAKKNKYEPAKGKNPLLWSGKYIFWFTESSANFNTTWLHMSYVISVDKVQKLSSRGKAAGEEYAIKVQTDYGPRTFHTDTKKLDKKLQDKDAVLKKVDIILSDELGEQEKYIHIKNLIEASERPVIL